MSSDLHRHDDAAEPATSQPIDQTYEQATDRTTLIGWRTINACHTRSFPYVDSLRLGRVHLVVEFLEKLGALFRAELALQLLQGQGHDEIIVSPRAFAIHGDGKPQRVQAF